ncbi:MAG: 1-acyl-sn-glycerol-3-phosphate acyltransferase [Gemmatimonadetes bacterium]|nr:1-acyl-sn-glycerol-3-phosphate acyltransferase [Gemmatimonadota bacterium]
MNPRWWHLAVAVLAAVAAWRLARTFVRRTTRRALIRFHPRVDRYKLTNKRHIVATLRADPEIAAAVERHAVEHGEAVTRTWARVDGYLDEIVPFFSILAYYKVGYAVSRVLLNLFYKVSVEYQRPDPFRGLPRDAVVIYLMNHRSNADYVVVAYALAGDVSLSYAVGEWARAFPLEYIFKSFGSYFIRRRYREPLYHTVLARYVQLITRNGVTQGIFPEGGLTRDGTLRPAKVGLLDYAFSVAADPAMAARMYVIPVAINYDRVLEDRSLLAELGAREGGARPRRWAQLVDVARYLVFNLGRLLTRRWQRYGRAAVTIGTPIPVSGWLDELAGRGTDLFALDRPARLGEVQQFCDQVMDRVGALIPVTPVCLACAALQTFDSEFVRKAELVARMDDLRAVLPEVNARVLRVERSTEEVLDRAYRMLRLRRVVARVGEGYLILARGRPLISYYANAVAHLLGAYAAGIRSRDALPSQGTLAELGAAKP